MLIVDDVSIRDFEAWAGAVDTQNKIIEENKCEDFEEYIDLAFPDGLTPTELNDILWFDSDRVFSVLGIDVDNED